MLQKFCDFVPSHHRQGSVWLRKTSDFFNPDFQDALVNSCSTSLRGKNVTVSLMPAYPYSIYLPDGRKAGGEVGLMDVLAEKIGFNHVYKEERTWFSKDSKTGVWYGIAGSVSNITLYINKFVVQVLCHRS